MWVQTSPSGCQRGILLAADQRLELGEMANPAAIAQERQPQRRPRSSEDQLLPLAEDPLWRQTLGFDLSAEFDRLGRGLQLETRGELHAAQDAQRVFGEFVGRVAQNAAS